MSLIVASVRRVQQRERRRDDEENTLKIHWTFQLHFSPRHFSFIHFLAEYIWSHFIRVSQHLNEKKMYGIRRSIKTQAAASTAQTNVVKTQREKIYVGTLSRALDFIVNEPPQAALSVNDKVNSLLLTVSDGFAIIVILQMSGSIAILGEALIHFYCRQWGTCHDIRIRTRLTLIHTLDYI